MHSTDSAKLYTRGTAIGPAPSGAGATNTTLSTIKRMLAYSSIAHAGYVLMAMVTVSELGTAAVVFGMLTMVFMSQAVVSHHGDEHADPEGAAAHH